MSDDLYEKLKAANNIVDKCVLILNCWGSYDFQETFAGLIDMDRWEENYAKNLAKPNIRQDVEDEIKMYKSWKERGI